MVGRFLVTTALEETWPADDVPVLFLGEWCRLYDRKSAWEKRDALVAPYHWDDRKKLHQDYLYLRDVYESSLSALTVEFAKFHGERHSVRYWRILVGPWLGYFIQMLFDRWFMLQTAVSSYEVIGVRIIDRAPFDLVPNDMTDWTSPQSRHQGQLFIGDNWTELITGQLFEWSGIPIERVSARSSLEESIPRTSYVSARSKIRSFLGRALRTFSRANDYFLLTTYLGLRADFSLQIRQGQVPQLWSSTPTPWTAVDPDARKWTLGIGRPNDPDEFLDLLGKLIPMHLPTAYLEGYRALLATTDRLPWPRCPKAIFDSNSWNSDDVFKAWAAARVESYGASLVLGQHGGNYGTALWNFNEEHQIAISDRFLTWGWDVADQQKVTPVGNFKDANRRVTPDPNGVALIVGNTSPRYSYHMYSATVGAGQWLDYFDEQCRFIDALPCDIKTDVLVRLYPKSYGLQPDKRWRLRFPDLVLDVGNQPMGNLLKKARIYISTYNATTYLESLSLNFPTLIFWNPKHWELRDSALPYFEKLKSVGVFHETPESAARQMATVWSDVLGWWHSADVQLARQEFCERYAKTLAKPLDELKKVFCGINDERGCLLK